MAAERPFFACHEARLLLFIFTEDSGILWTTAGPLAFAVSRWTTGAVRVAAKLEPSASVRSVAIAIVFFILVSLLMPSTCDAECLRRREVRCQASRWCWAQE